MNERVHSYKVVLFFIMVFIDRRDIATRGFPGNNKIVVTTIARNGNIS